MLDAHIRRSFFWIDRDNIRRNRERTVTTLKGTRALHSVECVEQHTVLIRQMSCFCAACSSDGGNCHRKEGNILFHDALNTFYLRLYGVIHMVKNHSDSKRGNLLLPPWLLFPISSKGSFICTIPQTG